jgi:hypothetical protein
MKIKLDENIPLRAGWGIIAWPIWSGLSRETLFDLNAHSCYNIITSPLFLREQGARRPCAASALFNWLPRYSGKPLLGVL